MIDLWDIGSSWKDELEYWEFSYSMNLMLSTSYIPASPIVIKKKWWTQQYASLVLLVK